MADLGFFWLEEQEDGSVKLMYEDLDVEMLGGDDIEVTYWFPKESVKKMIRILTNHYEGDLDEILCNEFGPCLEKKNFQTWLEENEIEYGSSAWRS